MGEYGPGDLVRLRSGGPLMTVIGLVPRLRERVSDAGVTYQCTWFRDNGDCVVDIFYATTLVRAEVPHGG